MTFDSGKIQCKAVDKALNLGYNESIKRDTTDKWLSLKKANYNRCNRLGLETQGGYFFLYIVISNEAAELSLTFDSGKIQCKAVDKALNLGYNESIKRDTTDKWLSLNWLKK